MSLRARRAAIHVNRVPDRLKRVKRNRHRQEYGEDRERRPAARVPLDGQEIVILKNEEHAQAGRDAEPQDQACPLARHAFEGQARRVSDQGHEHKEDKIPGPPRAVKIQTCR